MTMTQGVLVAVLAATMASVSAAGPPVLGHEPALGFWQVRDVQMRLARMGYTLGDVDGTLGPRTRTALLRFQEHRGFRPSGRLDAQTLAALDVSSTATSDVSR